MATRQCPRFSPAQNDLLRSYNDRYEALGPHAVKRRVDAFNILVWAAYCTRFDVAPQHERLIRYVSDSSS
ncbi:hypothetical protein PENSPDRAFT_653090 [Peniophora sp. CONT]|nr:hypothetical protein PENSPDRAFT_653090 [Peniophora sp. CONT]